MPSLMLKLVKANRSIERQRLRERVRNRERVSEPGAVAMGSTTQVEL